VRIHGLALSSFLGSLFSLLPTDEFKRRGVRRIRRHKIHGLTNGFQSSVSCSWEVITVVQSWSVIADPLAREIRSCWQGQTKFIKKDNVTQQSSKSHHHRISKLSSIVFPNLFAQPTCDEILHEVQDHNG